MKSILLLTATLLLAGQPTYAQIHHAPQLPGLTKDDYLRRSRQQKTVGTILVIGGGALALVGGALWFLSPVAGLSESGNVDGAKRTGQTMVLAGTTIGLISIPFFISSAKNKKAAVIYTGSTEWQHFPLVHGRRQMLVGVRVSL